MTPWACPLKPPRPIEWPWLPTCFTLSYHMDFCGNNGLEMHWGIVLMSSIHLRVQNDISVMSLRVYMHQGILDQWPVPNSFTDDLSSFLFFPLPIACKS